jgi:ribose-phosphate pyrophosphokinase
MSLFHRVCIFSGTANPELANEIVTHLGLRLGDCRISHFADGESFVEIRENVRGVDTYVIQPTSKPVNEAMMELLIMVDALRRASAGSITAVMPYYGYARQDRKVAPRTPISAKLCADLLVTSGVSRVVSIDLHAGQIQGFFNIPFDNLYAMPVMLDGYLRKKYDANAVFVSPDAGGVERARAYSKRVNANLAIIDKRRERANESEVMHLIGDVTDRDCVIVDDLVDTAGTVCLGAKALMDHGARSVVVCATHAVLSGPALQRIIDSPISELIVTNTIQLSPEAKACSKIRQLSVAPLLAEALRRIHHNDSVSSLFA